MSNYSIIRQDVFCKDGDIASQYLNDLEWQLQAVLHYMERLAQEAEMGAVIYTSILRPDDKGSPHSEGRAADVRIWHPDRGIAKSSKFSGFDPEDAEMLADWLSQAFGPFDGGHPVALCHGEGMDYHMHIQAPNRTWK